MTEQRIRISGSPSDEEAAAVVAVIGRLLEEEAVVRAVAPRAPRPTAWVLATMTREAPAAVSPSSYDALAWAELERPVTDH